MGFRRLQDGLITALDSSANAAPMPGRTFERTQGCWNCIHAKSAKERWAQIREAKLNEGVRLALELKSQGGEDHPKVVAIRRYVEMMDQMIPASITCDVGETAKNEKVGDFVANSFLCHKWTARDGASIARAGAKADLLPEELQERVDGSAGPLSADQVARKFGDAS